MRHGLTALLLAAVLASAAAVPGAGATDHQKTTLAILDVGRVFKEAKALRSLQAKLQQSAGDYRAETQKEEQEIRNAQEELARKRSILLPDAYEVERRRLEQRLTQAQASVQRRKQSLDEAQQIGLGQVQAVLNHVVTRIAAERGLTLILRKDQTVLADAALEITDDVLARLNAELDTVDLEKPGN